MMASNHHLPQQQQVQQVQQQQQQYAFELNEHDVLCGRGSGPNDRVGNINFRNLVLSRKADYLAAPSRDAKGRIATNIVDTIRGRGGRFLKKLSPTQVKEAGFKRGTAVYELADEPTVLEKAKQTLRQNRAEFVQKINEAGGELGAEATPSGETVAAEVTKANAKAVAPPKRINGENNNVSGGNNSKQQQRLPTLSQQQLNQNVIDLTQTQSIGGSLNPVPLDASAGLDSMQRPNLSARTAAHLQETLFAASSNMSSVTNPSFGTQSGNMTSSGGQNSVNYSILSMDTAELCAAMGGSYNNGNMSLNSFEQSASSAQAFGNLLQEYNKEEEKTLMQQYEQLKAQQQILLQQQEELPQTYQQQRANMGYIPEEQQQLEFQQQQLQGHQQHQAQQGEQEQNPSDVFASLLRQYDTFEQNLRTSQQQEQRQHQYKPKRAQQQQQNIESTPSNSEALPGSLIRQLSVEDQSKLLQQFQQLHNPPQADQTPAQQPHQTEQKQQQGLLQPQAYKKATAAPVNDLDATQTLQMYNDFTALLNQQQAATEGQHHEGSLSHLKCNESSATLKMGNSYLDSSLSGLKMGNASFLGSSPPLKVGNSSYVDSSAPLKMGPSYLESSLPLNDLQPSKKQPDDVGAAGSAQGGIAISTFQNNNRRRARRSTFASDNNRTSGNSTSTMGTRRLSNCSNVEPADFTEESLRLSFLTANRLAKTLDDMSTMSMDMKASATSRASTVRTNLDCSMLSLMSMSLSEIAPEMIPRMVGENGEEIARKNGAETGGGGGGGGPPASEISVVHEHAQEEEGEEGSQKDMRFGESVMSLGALDEKFWNK